MDDVDVPDDWQRVYKVADKVTVWLYEYDHKDAQLEVVFRRVAPGYEVLLINVGGGPVSYGYYDNRQEATTQAETLLHDRPPTI